MLLNSSQNMNGALPTPAEATLTLPGPASAAAISSAMLWTGKPVFTMQFNFGDCYLGKPVDINPAKPARWAMPPELAGVLWIDNTFPFGAQWRPNAEAVRPAPNVLADAWA